MNGWEDYRFKIFHLKHLLRPELKTWSGLHHLVVFVVFHPFRKPNTRPLHWNPPTCNPMADHRTLDPLLCPSKMGLSGYGKCHWSLPPPTEASPPDQHSLPMPWKPTLHPIETRKKEIDLIQEFRDEIKYTQPGWRVVTISSPVNPSLRCGWKTQVFRNVNSNVSSALSSVVSCLWMYSLRKIQKSQFAAANSFDLVAPIGSNNYWNVYGPTSLNIGFSPFNMPSLFLISKMYILKTSGNGTVSYIFRTI